MDAPVMSRNMSALYAKYRKKGPRDGIRVGRARIAALTREHAGRPVYRHDASEFFEESTALYSPRYTLDRLISEDRVVVEDGVLVERWEETEEGIRVWARSTREDTLRSFEGRKLLLAAGAINTSRIVLQSAKDFETTLPLFENPAIQFPLVMPRFLGSRLETDAFGLVQLNLVWDSIRYGMRLQGSLMEITSPSRAEFFSGFPYCARSNLALVRRMLPGMIVMQLFFPGEGQAPARLSLGNGGALRITGEPNRLDLTGLGPLLQFLRSLGAYTVPRLLVRVPTGHAVHYACTLPSKAEPERYQCYPDGRLYGTRGVYVADSASFAQLSAKNMSFAMMANAMRVAALATKGGP